MNRTKRIRAIVPSRMVMIRPITHLFVATRLNIVDTVLSALFAWAEASSILEPTS